jgi:HPt (histidine-containing phosphotransfer) domain-containing protein
LEQSPRLLAAIDRAAAAMQAEALLHAVHSLKSSTANLGGSRLALVAKECESLAREGAIAQLAPLVSRIHGEYQEFCAALIQQSRSAA